MKLSQRAMLASLNIRRWQATRNDKKVSGEVATAHNVSERRAGHYRKHVIDVESLTYKAVVSAASDMRNKHYELTLPWGQDGARILTTAMFEQYSDEMRHLRSAFDKAVAAFVADYPILKLAAKRELNGMYNEKDYPASIGSKFGADVVIMPLPEADDFRASLSSDVVDDIKESIEAELAKTTAEAMRDPYQRLFDHIGRMVERLSDKKAIFRDTLVTGLADLCSILPGLNLTNDPKLDDLRKRAEGMIAGIDAQTLRESPAVRRNVAKKAREIQDVMAAFMGAATAVEDAA